MPKVGLIFKLMCPRWVSFQIDVLKVGLIFKLMCPRWASFSNFKLVGHIQRRRYRNNRRGNEHFLCVSFVFVFWWSHRKNPRDYRQDGNVAVRDIGNLAP